MTNKTIALSRELGSDPITHMAGLLELVVNPRSYPIDILHAQIRSTLELVRAALADPVPPAGGEPGSITLTPEHVERLINRLSKAQMFKEVTELRAVMTQPVRPLAGLPERHDFPHRSEFETANQYTSALDTAKTWNAAWDEWAPHVTRLQAEVERLRGGALQQVCDHLNEKVEALQSELTKARKLFRSLRLNADPALFSPGQLAAVDEFISNQSAPADKDEECVHDFRMFSGECHKCGADWIPGKEYAPADKGRCEAVAWQFYQDGKWWNGDDRIKDHRKNTVDAGYKVRDLYAEQPVPVAGLRSALAECIRQRDALKAAPVAVALPERKTVKAGLLSESNTHNQGWNACLDEVARLNSEPKP